MYNCIGANPRTKNDLSLRVYGVYSLPESWKEKANDPSEEAYLYQARFWGVTVEGAKIYERQPSEEEKAQAEALKGKKGKGDEEPLPEEVAYKEKLDKQREEYEEMGERERYFKIHEDPSIDTNLKFNEPKQVKNLLKDELWEFEELVNDDNGAYIEFNKIQAPEDDDPKKKGKGKGDSLPQSYAKGWVDFTPLLVPGKKHTVQRVLLKACGPPPKQVDAEGEDDDDEDQDEGEDQEPEPIFEDAQTYIHIHISTKFAINPSIRPGEEEEPEVVEAEGEEGEGDKGEGDAEKEETPPQEEPPQEEAQPEGEGEKEPEDSFVEEEDFIEDTSDKIKIDETVYQDIDSNLGYFARTQDSTSNFRCIIQKYLKKISDHYSIVMAPDETEQKANAKVTAIPTHSTAFQRQKRIEKYIFQSDKMYAQLKKELKMAIHRIICDKYHKTVSGKGLDKDGRAKFISNLYTYLVQQISFSLHSAIMMYKDKLHEDLIEDLIASTEAENIRRNQTFREVYKDQVDRLAIEYENIGNFPMAEFYYKKLVLLDPYNVDRLLDLARFSMKQNKVDRAYEFFRRAKDEQPDNQNITLAFASILIERERYSEAKKILKQILDQDFKHCHANILYSLICEYYNRPGLVRKHIAIAKVQRMRELELLPRRVREIPNLNEINFKLERPNWNNITTKDQNMDSKENDKLFFEVIDFLLKNHLIKVANSLLKYIQNTESDKYRLDFAKVKKSLYAEDEETGQKVLKYSTDAIESLDKILEKNENNSAALILRGNIYYESGNIFDSEESYVRFVQFCNMKDAESRTHYYNILERLGMIYIERKAWQDAKTVFLKCTAENNTMNSWLNLGISCLRLHEYEEAEDALSQANYLDDHNPTIWAYIALLCLKYPNDSRHDQAEFWVLRALFLKIGETNINDSDVLEEIGDIYADKKPKFAIAWFNRAIEVNPERGELYQKYGNVLLSYDKNQNSKAIDLFKKALEKITGENNKSHVALVLQETLKEEGRDDEAEEYAQYTQNNLTTT